MMVTEHLDPTVPKLHLWTFLKKKKKKKESLSADITVAGIIMRFCGLGKRLG